MDSYGIEIEHKSGFEMYKSGIYNDYIRTALENVDRIKEIFNQYRREPLADDWLPYNPICEECGRVNTTYAYDFDGDIIKYRCDCGHEGEMDIKSGNGKLYMEEWNGQQGGKYLMLPAEPFGERPCSQWRFL